MRITLIISALMPGGAERVMARMANYWSEKNNEVSMITLDSESSDFYELHPRINRYALNVMHESTSLLNAAKNNLFRIKKLRAVIKESRPEVIVSFMDVTNVLTLLATRGLRLKVIVSERVDPSQHYIGRVESSLRRLTYPWATVVVVQTEHAAQWVKLNMNYHRVMVIPNPIFMDKVSSDTTTLSGVIKDYKDSRTIVAMGRMCEQKGFDILMEAFAIAVSSSPEWRLVIFGEGQERNRLVSLIRELALDGKVFMPGVVKNPMQFLKQADLFVMSSRFEGFPNALLEAMACGLPVISFDCPSGPGEIIRDGVDGVLVLPEDINSLANAMKRLMADEEERKRLGARAVEVLDRFGIEKVMKQWEELLQ